MIVSEQPDAIDNLLWDIADSNGPCYTVRRQRRGTVTWLVRSDRAGELRLHRTTQRIVIDRAINMGLVAEHPAPEEIHYYPDVDPHDEPAHQIILTSAGRAAIS